jgi:hypothetical protein
VCVCDAYDIDGGDDDGDDDGHDDGDDGDGHWL